MIGAFLLLAQAVLPAATEVQRWPAEEAKQGVAATATHVFAIDNSAIGKYDRRTGRRVAQWRGDPTLFKHMNSCTVRAERLVCAASNYPDVPQASSVETFDLRTLRHLASRSIGPGRGSLTWLEWRDGSWWAGFANYDGRGGEPPRDHRWTTLVRFSPDFAEQGAWLFPPAVLARMKPFSSSGGAWRGSELHVTGHDAKEVYVLRLPTAGSTLLHVGTYAFPSPGQAIQFDSAGLLWSIDRPARALVASRPPPPRP